MEIQVVSGRESRWPRVVKEALVSPRPCRRIKTFVTSCEAGAGYVSGSCSDIRDESFAGSLRRVILRVIDEGKSSFVGNRPGIMQVEC